MSGAVGVDGWRGRWVVAVIDNRSVRWSVHATFVSVLDAYPNSVVAVDMPVTTTDGPRVADLAARTYLRGLGGSSASIFLTPTTATVAAWSAGATHAEAMRLRPAGTPGTSIQAWHLIRSIVQVRDALEVHPTTTVLEAHPECSFRTLDPRIGPASKKTGLGVGRRLRALRAAVDVELADAPSEVPVEDLLDSVAVAWTAARYTRGESLTLPANSGEQPAIHV